MDVSRPVKHPMDRRTRALRALLVGGDRRSIARSDEARVLLDRDPSLLAALAGLTEDPDWLVVLRALDLMEKIAHDHPERIAPHKRVFIGALAESDRWEVRLQIVRALPLFSWTGKARARAEQILMENVDYPQTFVRAWALDSLATFAKRNAKLISTVARGLRAFEKSGSKALQARARSIRARVPDRRKKPAAAY